MFGIPIDWRRNIIYNISMKHNDKFIKEVVLKELGGHQEASKYFGITSQAISMWKDGKEIPRIHQLTLMINMPRVYQAV